MELLFNYPLVTAIIAVSITQLLKLPINYVINRRFEPLIIFSNGGMPSSHSSLTAALATAIGIHYGVGSPLFAIAIIFALVTMWDAAGIRYQASKHAQLLNLLIKDFQLLIEQIKYRSISPTEFSAPPLKEILGHKPLEVMVGMVLGIIVAFIVALFY
jgi:acid phosphatase family membrane protein YuiD